jgi:hypothetical protein
MAVLRPGHPACEWRSSTMSSALAANGLRGVRSGPRRRSIRTRFAVLCGAVLLAAGGVLLAP